VNSTGSWRPSRFPLVSDAHAANSEAAPASVPSMCLRASARESATVLLLQTNVKSNLLDLNGCQRPLFTVRSDMHSVFSPAAVQHPTCLLHLLQLPFFTSTKLLLWISTLRRTSPSLPPRTGAAYSALTGRECSEAPSRDYRRALQEQHWLCSSRTKSQSFSTSSPLSL
jgi:hypothetical protein